jgi:hypothetical protein
MTRDRFVSANTVRLELSDGDWIEVKERLTYGERSKLSAASFRSGHLGTDTVELDFEAYAVEKLATWLVDWSFTRAGKSVPVSKAAIRALDPETADEIETALNVHIEALEKKV